VQILKRNMKRKTLVLALALLFINQIFAQYGSRSRYQSDDEEPAHRFTVGIAPASLLFRSGKINLRGEWAYAHNKSLSILLAVPRATKIPSRLLDDLDVEENGQATKNRFTQFGITAENRFYFTKHAPIGFYLAPYLKYNRFGVTHTKTTDNQYETKVTGAIGGIGIGGSAGVQFRLGEHITMDLTFLGLDMKWMSGSLKYSSNDPENDVVAFRDKVQESVKDIPLIGSNLAAQIDGDQVKVRSPLGVWPGYRFNLSVNYAF
jgi:Protein of unknown function (DUF3575)